MTLIPINEFKWTDDYSYHRTLTCKNHPTARYSTKNPYDRNIHIITLPEGPVERDASGDCKCKFTDLMVIAEESDSH
jgi:hypothetical protein